MIRFFAPVLFSAVAVCMVAATPASAGLFGHRASSDCGCAAEPSCGLEPSCGIEVACAPSCGVEVACCGGSPRVGLFQRLHAMKASARLNRLSSCCAPEPSCGFEVAAPCGACEPSCGIEPSCGLEPSCCGSKRVTLRDRFAALKARRAAASACQPTCGCEPTCGIAAPTCGAEW